MVVVVARITHLWVDASCLCLSSGIDSRVEVWVLLWREGGWGWGRRALGGRGVASGAVRMGLLLFLACLTDCCFLCA